MKITTLRNEDLKKLLFYVLDASHISDEWDNRSVELVDIIFELDDYLYGLEIENSKGRE